MGDGIDEMQAVSPNHQASKLQIKDFTNLWSVSEAFGFSEAGAMLSDREKLILHFVATITISRYDRLHSCLNCGYQRDLIHPGTGRENRDAIINGMIEDVRQHRCRSMTIEDMGHLLEEINEEMTSGKILFHHMTDEMKWSMTGERPNKNTNWRDMR